MSFRSTGSRSRWWRRRPEARARLEAVFDGEMSLRDRIDDRLRAAGCGVIGLSVETVYVPESGIALDESGLSCRVGPGDRRRSGGAAIGSRDRSGSSSRSSMARLSRRPTCSRCHGSISGGVQRFATAGTA